MTRCALYRMYDADGRLVYAGISTHPLRRAYEHSLASEWASRVCRAEHEWFETRAAAAAAERDCIRAESPTENLIGGDASSNAITLLLDSWPARKVLAAEIGANVEQVHKWAKFGRIPSSWMLRVLEAAQRMGMAHVTADWMVKAHASTPREASA